MVDAIDIHDRKVGMATLAECLDEGLLHRAVAVLVFRKNGSLLLQRRSLSDMWHPGRWTLSCTGHVKAGESYARAARRELQEELGLRARLRLHRKILLPEIRSRGLTEWETTGVFACRSSSRVTIDRSELEEVAEVPLFRLRAMMKGRSLTPDARLILEECWGLVQDELGAGVPV